MAEPYAERTCSGKVDLRVGESLHRRLAMEAAHENLSLNQYVLRRLASPRTPTRDIPDQ